MAINEKREAIKKAYPRSTAWHAKVDAMPEAQVMAVYSRLSASANKTQKRYKDLGKKA
jgi:hypothetical protein